MHTPKRCESFEDIYQKEAEPITYHGDEEAPKHVFLT
jgi:hypothetical protein